MHTQLSYYSVRLAKCEPEWVAEQAGSSGSMVIAWCDEITAARWDWMRAVCGLFAIPDHCSHQIELLGDAASVVRFYFQSALSRVSDTTQQAYVHAEGPNPRDFTSPIRPSPRVRRRQPQ